MAGRVFKRDYTKEDIIDGKLYNAFYRTGFMNEEVYESKARDIFPHVLKLLSDTNTASVFENIAVGYQEIPYSEHVLQQLLSREFKDDQIHKKDIETYVSINLLNLKFYRFLFISNPVNVRNDKKVEIANTIKLLREKYSKEFTLIDSVMKFLDEQLLIHTKGNKSNSSGSKTGKHLIHENDIVTLVIPQLIDNSYYNINGVKRYPYLTEQYLHIKTKLGQLSFIFKTKQEKPGSTSEKRKYRYIKKQSFFDVGEYTTLNGELKEIFYVKLLGKFYNPFLFFDLNDINELLIELDSEELLKENIKRILKNTYEVYLEEVEVVRSTYGNLVPNIMITKENDSYYDEIKDRLQAYEKMRNAESDERINDVDDDECIDCDNEDEDEDDLDTTLSGSFEIDEEDDPEEEYDVDDEEYGVIVQEDAYKYDSEIEELKRTLEERDRFFESKKENFNDKRLRLSRNALSISKLKSLIMGYNGEKKFAYYPHLADILLKYTDLNDVKSVSGVIENPKQFPKSFQIVKTIGNDELFFTDDGHNPIDWVMPFLYRKTLIQTSELGTSGTSDMNIPTYERYLVKDELGLIDPHTKKSETAAGLLAAVNPFVTIKNRLEVK